MGRPFASFLLLFSLLVAATGCSKNAQQTVTGTINGKPALTLYGNSGKTADYMLLDSSAHEVSYDGQLYTYYTGSANAVYISVATASVVSGVLATASGQTVLTITFANTVFSSTQYASH